MMILKTIIRGSGLAALLVLSACSTISNMMSEVSLGDNSSTSISSVPGNPPPSYNKPSKTATPSSNNVASSLVIYISSRSTEPGYVAVQQNGQLVYVDPRQTMTRNDLSGVTTAQDAQGNAYLRLAFSASGAQKLQRLTSANSGRYLTVTMDNQLKSILQINQAISNGQLAVPMSSMDDAKALESRILDGD